MQYRRNSAKTTPADRSEVLKNLITIAEFREKRLRHQLSSLISQQQKLKESEQVNRARRGELYAFQQQILSGQQNLSTGDFLVNNEKLNDLFHQECNLLGEQKRILLIMAQLSEQQHMLNEKIRRVIVKKEKLRIALTDEY